MLIQEESLTSLLLEIHLIHSLTQSIVCLTRQSLSWKFTTSTTALTRTTQTQHGDTILMRYCRRYSILHSTLMCTTLIGRMLLLVPIPTGSNLLWMAGPSRTRTLSCAPSPTQVVLAPKVLSPALRSTWSMAPLVSTPINTLTPQTPWIAPVQQPLPPDMQTQLVLRLHARDHSTQETWMYRSIQLTFTRVKCGQNGHMD
jgi:hypothetical protein